MLEPQFPYVDEKIKKYDSFETLQRDYTKQSKSGYSCPSCDNQQIEDPEAQTPARDRHEEGSEWYEGFTCSQCKTKYTIHNGT
ncbi:hypothetical protein M1M30_gp173 [Maribacter phage Colly_1]|uniref:Uncharacterized protein n=1 Tax=Maribacter phage Colly_1 TaxID=2745691 RepID=A0A8E4XV97_9CAUD|nr:hypothetical protein M1M30_gp173 [Maribacter phage Colly_1]QQO97277.1 hypothetical protein Colly1_173 [Maribacter phage Colly_1]